MSGQYPVITEIEVLKYVIAVILGVRLGYIWISYRNRSILGYVVASAIAVGVLVFVFSYIPGEAVVFFFLLAIGKIIKEKLFG